jgi:DNA-binding transcriptional LysR family regulator
MQGQSNWRFLEGGQTISVHVSGPVRVNSPFAARDAALAGLGVAFLPGYLATEAMARGELVAVLGDYVAGGATLQAVYPHRRHLAGKVRALIDHLVEWFQRNPIS